MTTALKKLDWKQAVLIAALILISLFMLVPFLWAFATSLRLPKDSFNLPPSFFPTEWRWDNYTYVFHIHSLYAVHHQQPEGRLPDRRHPAAIYRHVRLCVCTAEV